MAKRQKERQARGPAPLGLLVWSVPEDGFRWHGNGRSRRLRPVNWPLDSKWRTYAPLWEHPELFRRSAQLGETPEEIVNFANEYGSLREHNDSLAEWIHAMRRLRRAISVWDAAQTPDFESMKVLGVTFTPSAVHWTRTRASRLPGWALRSDRHRALFAAQALLNEGVQTSAVPKLFYDKRRDSLQLHLAPRDLFGALWLQCALALDRGMIEKRCERCGGWFIGRADGRGRKGRFCSAQCRLSSWRNGGRVAVRVSARRGAAVDEGTRSVLRRRRSVGE
jgi:hypothetical protein